MFGGISSRVGVARRSRAVARSYVGTVAQAAGLPIGAIIERGSNANGEYARYADGTQVCWFNGANVSITAQTSGTVSWTFPAAFSAVPVVTLTHRGTSTVGANAIYCAISAGPSTTAVTACGFNNNASTTRVFNADMVAIGRSF